MLDLPLCLRATHMLNILFHSLLARNGLEILSARLTLHWHDDCAPGSEWLRFTKKQVPKDKLWTGRGEEEPFSSWVALPGHQQLGPGRHWHFSSVVVWLTTGLMYVVLMFATNKRRRFIPTSWSVGSDTWCSLLDYRQLRIPAETGYNGLQQLSYFGVVFLLAPFMLPTGTAMSPAIAAQFPRYIALFDGRQWVRNLHFLVCSRLRQETQLGFKMVKYLSAIKVVNDYRTIREGQGGWCEDIQHYSREAGI